MSDQPEDKVQAAVDGVLEFADELEASGDATFGGDKLAHAKAVLHKWVDSATAVVAVPAFGRVALIHADGTQSTISARDLPFAISVPVNWAVKD